MRAVYEKEKIQAARGDYPARAHSGPGRGTLAQIGGSGSSSGTLQASRAAARYARPSGTPAFRARNSTGFSKARRRAGSRKLHKGLRLWTRQFENTSRTWSKSAIFSVRM